MSGAAQPGDARSPIPAGAHAELAARFTLHADREQDVAQAAAELIRRLQEMASLPDCAYDLDIDVQWPAAKALASGGAGAPPPASAPSGSH